MCNVHLQAIIIYLFVFSLNKRCFLQFTIMIKTYYTNGQDREEKFVIKLLMIVGVYVKPWFSTKRTLWNFAVIAGEKSYTFVHDVQTTNMQTINQHRGKSARQSRPKTKVSVTAFFFLLIAVTCVQWISSAR